MKIELKDMSYAYKANLDPVIHDINLTLDKPGLYCIVGPNGVGKSTMIKCINKIFKPTSGNVYIDDVDVAGMKLKEVAEKVGYVPVQSQDVFSMPVVDAILLGRQNKSRWKTTSEDMAIVTRVMKMMGIENLAMRGYNELSAGQHQKVSLARGLVQQTPALLLDEPTANLDAKHQVYVTELLRGLAIQDGKIVLMISHDINVSAKYAHEVIIMGDGTILEKGDPRDVITEELINQLYNVDCRVVDDEGRPHVILGSVLNMY